MGQNDDGQDLTSAEVSIQMLKAVVEGATYERVGRAHGLTRTAVERRVKNAALHLHRSVGVRGLTDDSVAHVRRLRTNGDAILRALDGFDPNEAPLTGRDKPIRVYSKDEILAAAGRVRAYSSQPRRDVALFLLLFATGARPLEIARLQVRDYLQPDGSVRKVSQLRSDAAIGGAARPLYFSSARLDEALLQYLHERRSPDAGPGTGEYGGLDPRQPLFLGGDGRGFAITVYSSGGQRRHLCRPILEAFRKIFRYAGLAGASPLAVRATVAARLYARGADDRQVGRVLGIAQRSGVRQRFPRVKPSLAELVEDLI